MRKMTNEDRVRKWLANELSDSERKEFEGTETFAKVDRLLRAVDSFKAPEYDIDGEFCKLSEGVLNKKRAVSLFERFSPVFRIAAIVVVAFLIGFLSYSHLFTSSDGQVWIAEQSEVFLPDSSFVRLNADSKISFSADEWSDDRSVVLKGEAFFRVKKGSRFDVKTPQGVVSVLGTVFNVKDWDAYYEVTCFSGSVRVVSAQSTVVLKPGMAYRIINDKEDNYTVSNLEKPEWINGESSFDSVPFNLVIKELERQYKVSVKTVDVDLNQLFTGSFSHNNLEIALKAITIPINSSFKINGNQIVISFEGK